MRLGPAVIIGLVVAGASLPLAWSARRLGAARDRSETAATALENARTRAGRAAELRASVQRVAEQKRPDQDLIARASAVLIGAGIPNDALGAVRTQSDTALGGTLDSDGPSYHRQTVQLMLRRLALDEIGRFLGEWTATQELWTPTQIVLSRERASRDSGQYNATIVVSTTYIGER